MKLRTYSELRRLPTFEERYRYLQLNGVVGQDTFGVDRYLNQKFYQRDQDWLKVRRQVIIRDNGCDLGCPGHEIPDRTPIIIHHMNPITLDDILNRTDYLLNPDYLISTIDNTHKAIHYSNESLLITLPPERSPNDTCPWKR